ncbi:MAG TPA: hypothetical protein PK760_13165, partial [Flavobacteriales bacterium]|nr:hypothetical protein [Flavobacteriales bacterium]
MQRTRLLWWTNYAACIALLIWPAIYNGYPILYSDTATYVASGMKLDAPMDRPITYGLFIRITSIGGFTLWTTIVAQAAILTALLHGLIDPLIPPGAFRRWALLAII